MESRVKIIKNYIIELQHLNKSYKIDLEPLILNSFLLNLKYNSSLIEISVKRNKLIICNKNNYDKNKILIKPESLISEFLENKKIKKYIYIIQYGEYYDSEVTDSVFSDFKTAEKRFLQIIKWYNKYGIFDWENYFLNSPTHKDFYKKIVTGFTKNLKNESKYLYSNEFDYILIDKRILT